MHSSAWQRAFDLNPALAGALDASRVIHNQVRLYEPAALVVPGTWCEQSRNHYLHGQCALFALLLQAEIPGSLIALAHGSGGVDEWVHALVRMPSGQAYDARGAVDETGVLRHWNATAPAWGPFTITTLISQPQVHALLGHLTDAESMDREVARAYARAAADAIWNQYDTLPITMAAS